MKRPATGRRWAWIFLGAGAYALHLALGKESVLVENFYSRGVFVGLRWLWDRTLGHSPVPLIYVFLALAVLWDIWIFVRWRRSRGLSPEWRRPSELTPEEYRSDIYVSPKGASVPAKVGKALLVVASWAGIFVFFFYVLWGFNYDRVGLEGQLRLEVRPLDLTAVKAEALDAVRIVAESRAMIPGAGPAALGPGALPPNLEAKVRNALSKVLADAGYPVSGRARVRPLWPGSLLMRFSSTGFYFPYCGEGYIADNLTASEKPFVTAHEMVHAYGITDEGAANLLGFLACEFSDNPSILYSGVLSYWNYVFSELLRLSKEDAVTIAARLPEGAKADLRAAFENWDRYRGPARAAARAVYERYLKSQGVKEGLKSYDRFVSLVVAWRSGRKK